MSEKTPKPELNLKELLGGREVVTRFAPSPTGLLHGGNYRTALFCYLVARHYKGTFYLRIEDTDRARSKKEYEDNILETLNWLSLKTDPVPGTRDGIWRQSERKEAHTAYLKKLIAEGKAYVSTETNPETKVTSDLIRFKNPNKKVTFNDAIRGPITFDTTEHADFIIAKNIEEPVFHFAVVADDADMGVTVVIRGEDHISNTARHILIQEALGVPTPLYAHLPLVLATDRTKLSKRKGAKALTQYRDAGILPEAMINFLALTGWNPAEKDAAGKEREIFSVDELISKFRLDRVQKSSAIFNEEKLHWINKEHMKLMPTSAFADIARATITQHFASSPLTTAILASNEHLALIARLASERSETLVAVADAVKSMSYLFQTPSYDPTNLMWKESVITETQTYLQKVHELIRALPADAPWTNAHIKEAVWNYVNLVGKGHVLWPFRIALSGAERSPDPFTLAELLGRAETEARLATAINALEKLEQQKTASK